MRIPEGISAARLYVSKRSKVLFDIYEYTPRKVNKPVHRIFNADETGIISVQHRHGKFVSMRGKKEVASLTSATLSPV